MRPASPRRYIVQAQRNMSEPPLLPLTPEDHFEYSPIHGKSVDGFFVFRCEGFEKSPKSGMVRMKKCESRKTLKNLTLDAKIGVDRAANEPRNRKHGQPSYRESERM